MRQAIRIGRLGMLAGGMSIGAALASTPQDRLGRLVYRSVFVDRSSAEWSVSPRRRRGGAVGLSDLHQRDGLVPNSGQHRHRHLGYGRHRDRHRQRRQCRSPTRLLNFAFADGTNTFADTAVGTALTSHSLTAPVAPPTPRLGGANLDFAVADGAGSHANVGLGANLDDATAIGTGSHAHSRNRRQLMTPHSPTAPVALPMPASATMTSPPPSAPVAARPPAWATVTSPPRPAAAPRPPAASLATAFADGANSDAEATGIGRHRLGGHADTRPAHRPSPISTAALATAIRATTSSPRSSALAAPP